MLSLHVKGWVVLSHAKGWVVIAHVSGWVVLPNAKGRVVLRTTLSLTWDDNPPPPDLPWCIRYYLCCKPVNAKISLSKHSVIWNTIAALKVTSTKIEHIIKKEANKFTAAAIREMTLTDILCSSFVYI